MSTVKSKKLQVGTDATATNNFTIYQPASPDGTLRIGVGNADSPTEVAQLTSSGLSVTGNLSVTGSVPANTGPAFSAYDTGGNQTINNVTSTKVNFSNTSFDTASDFDTSNARFIPSVEGYYQLNAHFSTNAYGGNSTNNLIRLYKNGAPVARGSGGYNATGAWFYGTVSALVYANGTTDYFEIYIYQSSGTTTSVQSGSLEVRNFNGTLVRAA